MADILKGPPGEIFIPAVISFKKKSVDLELSLHQTLPNMSLLAQRLGDLDGRNGVGVAPQNHEGNLRFGEGFQPPRLKPGPDAKMN